MAGGPRLGASTGASPSAGGGPPEKTPAAMDVAVPAENAPSRFELEAVMASGDTVHIRPIRPMDAAALATFHDGLSPETVYRRFLSTHPHLRPAEIDHFVHVDYRSRLALVGEVDGTMVAVARYDQSAPGRAEVAFVVADRCQGLGLGTLLLEHLAAAARAQGITTFFADTQAGNHAMLEVFGRTGFAVEHRRQGGLVELSFPIAPTAAYLAALNERHGQSIHHWLQGRITSAPARVPPGRLGIVCQSPARAAAVAAACRANRVGASVFLAGQLPADISELVAYLAADAATDAIALELTHLEHPRRFVAAARAATARKPVVVLAPAATQWEGRHPALLDAQIGLWAQCGAEVVDRVETFVRRLRQLIARQRAGTWRPPAANEADELAALPDIKRGRAREALDGWQPTGAHEKEMPPGAARLDSPTAAALFGAYGIEPAVGGEARGPLLTVGDDPRCGLSARVAGPRGAASGSGARSARALPLTERDARQLAVAWAEATAAGPRSPEAGGPASAGGPHPEDPGRVAAVILRAAALADDLPEVRRVDLAAGGGGLAGAGIWAGPPRGSDDDPLVRRLAPGWSRAAHRR